MLTGIVSLEVSPLSAPALPPCTPPEWLWAQLRPFSRAEEAEARQKLHHLELSP